MRMTSAAVAAAIILVIVASFLVPQQASFAETAKTIHKAETVTWTGTTYTRFHSQDGKRTWLQAGPREEFAYRAPNLYRCTRFDEEGNVRWVEIVDNASNRALRLDMNLKTATSSEPINNYSGSSGPFAWVTTILEGEPVELVGQREVNGGTANVFRHHRERMPHKESVDIWLDTKTKQLVGFSDPGADLFDPTTVADRNHPAEETYSKGQMAGLIGGNIVFNPELDAELFSLTPPDGFEIMQEPLRPTVTEEELIEWLGVTAHVNGGQFGDTYRGIDLDRHNEIGSKKKADRTEAEQRFLDVSVKHMMNGNGVVMAAFANEYAVDGRFRYLGKGVTLGTAERIVCFYKLKSTGTFRAVYGDLTVKDVAPEDLPLPVEK